MLNKLCIAFWELHYKSFQNSCHLDKLQNKVVASYNMLYVLILMVHKFALMGVCINHVFFISEKDIKMVMCKLNFNIAS